MPAIPGIQSAIGSALSKRGRAVDQEQQQRARMAMELAGGFFARPSSIGNLVVAPGAGGPASGGAPSTPPPPNLEPLQAPPEGFFPNEDLSLLGPLPPPPLEPPPQQAAPQPSPEEEEELLRRRLTQDRGFF